MCGFGFLKSPGISFAVLFCCALFVSGAPVSAQSSCEIAERHYIEGNLDEAIRLAQALFSDPNVRLQDKICANRIFRESCCAKMSQWMESTRKSLSDIIDSLPGYSPRPDVKCPPPCPDLPSRLDAEFGSTLAVLRFNLFCPAADTGELGPLRQGLRGQLEAGLNQVAGLRLVERQRITELYEEIGGCETGLLDNATAAKRGRILGAQSVSFGGFTSLPGNQASICARIVRTETGEIVIAECVDGDAADHLNLMEQLGETMAEALRERGL